VSCRPPRCSLCSAVACSPLDLVIIVDASESQTSNMPSIKRAIDGIMARFSVSQTRVRVSTVVFNDDVVSAETRALNAFADYPALRAFVDGWQTTTGLTNTGA